MNNELLLLNNKHTITLIEQTKTRAQGKLEIKINKQRRTFYYSTPLNLTEEGKWLLAVTFFGTTRSVLKITDGKNSFSISTTGYWCSRRSEETMKRLR